MLKLKNFTCALVLVTLLLSACSSSTVASTTPTPREIMETASASYTPTGVTQTVPVAATPSGSLVWREYSSTSGKFKVLLPNMPTEEKLLDNVTVTKAAKNENSWVITVFENVLDSKSALDAVIDSQVRSLRGDLLSVQNITLGDVPGKEFDIRVASNLIVKTRILKKSNNLYLIQTNYKKDDTSSLSDAQKFLNSFQFT